METEEVVVFCRKNHKRNAFLSFENMRQNGEFCDVKLRVQDIFIKAHRAVLAATIPYFQEKFASDAKVAKFMEITFVGADLGAVESLIEFAYTGKVHIDNENALTLLSTSDFFQIEDIPRACIKYLSVRLCPRNVLQVRNMCLKYDMQDVLDKTDRYVIDNFENISDTPGFLYMKFIYLKKILRRDDLNVSTEEKVYEAIMRWVRIAPVRRQLFLPQLLHTVRIPQLPDDYLDKRIMTEELILSSDPCKKLLFGTIDYDSGQKNVLLHNFNRKPRFSTLERLSASPDQHALFLISYSDSDAHSVYRYDLQDYEWNCIGTNNLSSQCDYIYRTVAVSDKIFMFLERKVQVFNLKTRNWVVLKPLHYYVAGSGICVQNDKIYILGGYFDGVSRKVRCFDPQNEKWLEEGMMKEKRAESGAALLKRFIFITGGHSKGSALNSAELYDPETQKSTVKMNSLSSEKYRKISPMLNERCGHGCTSMNEKIYVCGGYQGKWHFLEGNESHREITETAEVYDPVINEWNLISSLYRPRAFVSLVSCAQKLYAAGGMTQCGKSTFHIEFYDPQLDEWDFCPQIPNYGENNTYVNIVTAYPTHENTNQPKDCS